MKVRDLTGIRFGRLVVIDQSGIDKHGRVIWNTVCDCGKYKRVTGSALINRYTTSCGCYRLECIRKPPGVAQFNDVYSNYVGGARKRGFTPLPKDDYYKLAISNCEYCGNPPSNKAKHGGRHYSNCKFNGVDRVDPTIPSYINNSASCCFDCNRSKGALKLEDWLDHISKIYKMMVIK